MSSPKILKDFIFIENIQSTHNKTTEKYRYKQSSNTIKNRVIAKTLTFTCRIKDELIQQQFGKLITVKSINPIKKILVEPEEKCTKLIILQEYEIKGNLNELIEGQQQWNYEIMLKICEGVAQLHKNNIGHFNLKPENILITSSNSIKFTDVSISYLNALQRKNSLPSFSKYLPQSQIAQCYDKQTDVWSIGIIFIQILLHRRLQPKQTQTINISNTISQIKNENLRAIVKRMCCPKQKRLRINEVMSQLKVCLDSKENINQQRYDFITLSIPLFSSQLYTFIEEPYQLQQHYSLSIKELNIQFNLFQYEQMQPILWIIITKEQMFSLSVVYTQLPSNLNKYFENMKQLFLHIKDTRGEWCSFDTQGNFTFRVQQMEAQIQEKKEELIIQQIQVKQQIKIPTISQKDSFQILEQVVQFESDDQQDMMKAYQSFLQPTLLIKQIKDTIRITAALQNPNIELISLQYENLGRQYSNLMQYEQAKRAYKVARQGFCRKYGSNSEKQMNLLSNLGFVYGQEQSFNKAKSCYKKCIVIGEVLGDFDILGTSYMNLGNISLYQKDFTMSQIYYLKSIDFLKIQNKNLQLQMVYQNLSKLYFQQQKYYLANSYHELCIISHAEKKGQKYGILQFNLAVGLLRLNQYQQAFIKFNQSFDQVYSLPVKKKFEEILIKQCQTNKELRRRPIFITKIKAKLSQQCKNSLERLFSNI